MHVCQLSVTTGSTGPSREECKSHLGLYCKFLKNVVITYVLLSPILPAGLSEACIVVYCWVMVIYLCPLVHLCWQWGRVLIAVYKCSQMLWVLIPSEWFPTSHLLKCQAKVISCQRPIKLPTKMVTSEEPEGTIKLIAATEWLVGILAPKDSHHGKAVLLQHLDDIHRLWAFAECALKPVDYLCDMNILAILRIKCIFIGSIWFICD